MTLGDWRKCTDALPDDFPLLFYLEDPIPFAQSYCDARTAVASRCWDADTGWQNCLLVELDKPFG